MYEFHKSENFWTEKVTFCISVTISEYFGAWNHLKDKRVLKLVFYGLWHRFKCSCLVTFHVMCGNMYMGLSGVSAICQTLRVEICVASRRGYVLRNASLANFVFVPTRTYTNLDSIAYHTPRLYGIAYCS